jgi:hypothetical protein
MHLCSGRSSLDRRGGNRAGRGSGLGYVLLTPLHVLLRKVARQRRYERVATSDGLFAFATAGPGGRHRDDAESFLQLP